MSIDCIDRRVTLHPGMVITRSLVTGVLALAAIVSMRGLAQAKELVSPMGVFVEGGAGDQLRSAVGGVAITWLQPSRWGAGHASGYLEASAGEWFCRKANATNYTGCSTQVGLTPVIRYQPETWSNWFMEAGIGVNAIFPQFHGDLHTLSTEFNFGDHLGLGRQFGDAKRDEVELRLEHYSNGGYRSPNPGADFGELRYMHWF